VTRDDPEQRLKKIVHSVFKHVRRGLLKIMEALVN
jgi:hypothetical protein